MYDFDALSRDYQEEFLHRGERDRAAGRSIDANPYRRDDHGWPDARFDAMRLMKNAPSTGVIEQLLSQYEPHKRDRILRNDDVQTMAARVEDIRFSASTLWEAGWLRGHRPGTPVDLSELLLTE